MRKIYLITLIILMGNCLLLRAGNPQTDKNYRSDSRSENVLQNRSKSGSIIQYRQPPNTNLYPLSTVYSDNFDGANDTTALKARGYLVYYRGGGAQGTSPTWFQGDNTTRFNSYNGPADGYVASDYNTVTGANNVDNWLILPSLAVDSGDVISFSMRAFSSKVS